MTRVKSCKEVEQREQRQTKVQWKNSDEQREKSSENSEKKAVRTAMRNNAMAKKRE